MRKPLIVAVLGIWLAAAASFAGPPKLAMRVSPVVALAPAFLTVRTTIEADADNRELELVVESPSFHRSSRIQLDGKDAPRLNVFELRDLPSGLYEVRATLLGSRGTRAATLQLVKVDPGPGSR